MAAPKEMGVPTTPALARRTRLLDFIRSLITAGQQMPTNEMLAIMFQTSTSTIAQELLDLRRMKVISVGFRGKHRVVTLVATGGATAGGLGEGRDAPRHSQKGLAGIQAARLRQERLAQQIAEDRKMASLRASGAKMRPIFPASTCQFPLWCDDARPTGIFCGARSVPGFSWCENHRAICYEKKAQGEG